MPVQEMVALEMEMRLEMALLVLFAPFTARLSSLGRLGFFVRDTIAGESQAAWIPRCNYDPLPQLPKSAARTCIKVDARLFPFVYHSFTPYSRCFKFSNTVHIMAPGTEGSTGFDLYVEFTIYNYTTGTLKVANAVTADPQAVFYHRTCHLLPFCRPIY